MTNSTFRLGDAVLTTRSPGTIIDVRATASGHWVYGVEAEDGEVGYFTSRGLRPATG